MLTFWIILIWLCWAGPPAERSKTGLVLRLESVKSASTKKTCNRTLLGCVWSKQDYLTPYGEIKGIALAMPFHHEVTALQKPYRWFN